MGSAEHVMEANGNSLDRLHYSTITVPVSYSSQFDEETDSKIILPGASCSMSIQRKDLRMSRSGGHEQSKTIYSLNLDVIHAESSVPEVNMDICNTFFNTIY